MRHDSKRVLLNTLILYFRLLVVMVVSLYSTRIVIEGLGIEDFGIYNLVAGMTVMFAFFTSSLSNSTQRFLNIEHGRNDISKARLIFNISLKVYFYISIVVLLLGEIIGLWLIHSKLVIPSDRLMATVWVFQASLISLFFTINGVVFQSVLIARENMKIYAYVGVFEALSKLIIAYIILVCNTDKLIIYAFLLTGVSVLAQIVSAIFCIKRYEECVFESTWNKEVFWDLFRFTGWNTFGCAVFILNFQGMNIVLNMFFGAIVNASRAISAQVEGMVNNFTNSFFTAVRPQIIKSYGARDMVYFERMLMFSSKFAYFLALIVCMPIMLRVDYILNLWLKDVPEYTGQFVVWVLVYSMVNVLTNPLWTAIQAVNKMRKYCLIGGCVFLSAFPISYVCLKFGCGALIVFQVVAAVRLIYVFVAFKILSNYVNITLSRYLKEVFVPILAVTVVSSVICAYVNSLFPNNFLSLIIVSILVIVVVSLTIFIFGVNAAQRNIILKKIKDKKYEFR